MNDIGAAVLLGTVVLATAVGLVLRRRDGRLRSGGSATSGWALAPEPARALDVLRTPTVVAFDRSGRELLRISGVPRTPDLLAALSPQLDPA